MSFATDSDSECPQCLARKMQIQRFENGHTLKCRNCQYQKDVPYGGYVPPLEKVDVEREV